MTHAVLRIHTMDKLQINVRLSEAQIEAIDLKRIELQPVMGKIPNRSEVLRYALDMYLGGGRVAHEKNAGPTDRGSKPGKKAKA